MCQSGTKTVIVVDIHGPTAPGGENKEKAMEEEKEFKHATDKSTF